MGAAAKVGIAVVHWHRPQATRACLQALQRLAYPAWELVVVDNGSGDLSAVDAAAIGARGCLVRSEVNRGFAGGANLAMRTALARGADWVWFLNDDARPEPAALDELLAVARATPPADVVGAKILRGDDPARLDSAALHVDLASGRVLLLGHDELDEGQYDRLTDPIAVTACAMLVSRAACAQLGGFEEAFFAYLEDADLCLRARAAGLRVAFAPRARVLHDRAPATRGRQSLDSLYYSTRNHLFLLQRHSPAVPWLRKLQELRVQTWCALYALRAGSGAPWQALRAVRRGVRDFRHAVVGRDPGSGGPVS